MPSLESIGIGKTWMVMLKGENGTGKSVAAASWPRPIHFVDFDGRLAAVRYAHRNNLVGISFDTYGPRNFWNFVDWFQKLQDSCPYRTIVLDSFTSMSTSAVTYQLLQKGLGTGKPKSGDDSSGRVTKGGLVIPGVEEYGGETSNLSIVLDIAKVLHMYAGVNIICTAHPLPKLSLQSGKSVRAITSYGSKIAAMAPNYFNEIYHFDVDNPMREGGESKYNIWTRHAGDDFAKTALPLPQKIEFTYKDDNPVFLYDILMGILEKEGFAKENENDSPVKNENSLKANSLKL